MLKNLSDNFKSNIAYLSAINKNIAQLAEIGAANIKLEQDSGGIIELFREGSIVIDDIMADHISSFQQQAFRARAVKMSRFFVEGSYSIENSPSINTILGSHDISLTKTLPLSFLDISHKNHYTSKKRDLVLLGSSHLFSLALNPNLLVKGFDDDNLSINTLTVVEPDSSSLATTLHLIDLKEFVDKTKSLGIKFHLICENDFQKCVDTIFGYFAFSSPLSLYGLVALKSPIPCPILDRIESWLFSSAGIGYRFLCSLGSSTDELNQLIQGIYNREKYSLQASYLRRSLFAGTDSLCCIVGSGPSLDQNLEYIKSLSESSYIVACGSSIRSLLKAGIRPNALAIVERGEEVYQDLDQVISEFGELTDILLVSALQVHPKVLGLFKNISFFHRPLSSLAALFQDESCDSSLIHAGPESVNVGFESFLHIGFTRFALFGVDFGKPISKESASRSVNAVGGESRVFDKLTTNNLGNSYLTQDSLLAAKRAFEISASQYSASIVRFGEGINLDCSLTEMLTDSEKLDFCKLNKLPLDTSMLIDKCSEYKLEKYNTASDDLNQLIDSVSGLISNLVDLLPPSPKDKSQHIFRRLNDYINYESIAKNSDHHAGIRFEITAIRLIRQVIYTSLARLYDNHSYSYDLFVTSYKSLLERYAEILDYQLLKSQFTRE